MYERERKERGKVNEKKTNPTSVQLLHETAKAVMWNNTL
jgi:hypothetical protein